MYALSGNQSRKKLQKQNSPVCSLHEISGLWFPAQVSVGHLGIMHTFQDQSQLLLCHWENLESIKDSQNDWKMVSKGQGQLLTLIIFKCLSEDVEYCPPFTDKTRSTGQSLSSFTHWSYLVTSKTALIQTARNWFFICVGISSDFPGCKHWGNNLKQVFSASVLCPALCVLFQVTLSNFPGKLTVSSWRW